MSKLRIKVADHETAGFKGPVLTNLADSGVCEVAWIEILPDMAVVDRFQSLVNPGRPIEQGAFDTHGISDEMVFGKPTFDTVYHNNWDDSPTVAIYHNKNFDLKFSSPYIPFLAGSLCTLDLARQYIPEAPNHKLATLAEYLGLNPGEAHRAAGDCETTFQLLVVIMQISGRTLPELIKLGEKPKVLTEMPFGMHKGKRFHELPISYLDWILATDDMPKDVKISAEMARRMK